MSRLRLVLSFQATTSCIIISRPPTPGCLGGVLGRIRLVVNQQCRMPASSTNGNKASAQARLRRQERGGKLARGAP